MSVEVPVLVAGLGFFAALSSRRKPKKKKESSLAEGVGESAASGAVEHLYGRLSADLIPAVVVAFLIYKGVKS